ncbi:MarR family transcriptional regulator [Brevibacillus sp. SYP-B805]|uniref:MarR family winged helix-turn-helix transcriptional regulator n=1 Tax=Brevibacillus sp. SYP-B805 TaxID=1578199 RepID=UPI0013EB778E|nr:MarR family transcriptional regulator [Brevibacillus sp. SYP-B805]NGQ96615.1 MarR family transcriptional regulator [Brevibacillus sp. SYP-B805]
MQPNDEIEASIDRLQLAFAKTMRKLGPELSEQEPALTGPQFFILNLLSKKGRCTVTALAEEMRVKPSAITAMVDRLVKHGFVLRDRDERDRRVVYVQLSGTGAKVLEQAAQKRKQIIRKYLSQLEHAELESLVRIFEKLARIVTRDSAHEDLGQPEKE